MHRFRHNKTKQITPVYKYNTVTQSSDLENTVTKAVEEEVAATAATSWWPYLIGLGFILYSVIPFYNFIESSQSFN